MKVRNSVGQRIETWVEPRVYAMRIAVNLLSRRHFCNYDCEYSIIITIRK